MEKLGFGIIGCGTIAEFHFKGIEACPQAELRGVADIVPERAKAFAEKYHVSSWYKDYQELFKRDDIEIVSICTPSGLHAEQALAAAEAGKHILCEKPMALTLSDADRMIKEARLRRIKLGVVFQRRLSRSAQKVKQALEEKKLGKLVLGDAYLKYYRSQEYYDSGDWRGTWALDGGGALMNQGIHGIDLLLWFMGEPASVYAKAGTLVRKIEVEDTCIALLAYKNGAFGVIEGTTSVYPGEFSQWHLHGERGTIILEEETIKKWEIIGEESQVIKGKDEYGGASRDPKAISFEGHVTHIQDIVRAVKEDREPLVPGEEARKVLELILGIYASARQKQEVYFPLKE
jgi:predicted dehydrogenase